MSTQPNSTTLTDVIIETARRRSNRAIDAIRLTLKCQPLQAPAPAAS